VFWIVPIDGEAAVEETSPVGGAGVEVLEGLDEMIGMLFANVLDSKVVDDEAENDGTCRVFPETWGSWCWIVAILDEMLGEALVGDDASLFEAVHAFFDFNVHPAVRCDNVKEMVSVDDFLGNGGDW
jgi:hypothetical protein